MIPTKSLVRVWLRIVRIQVLGKCECEPTARNLRSTVVVVSSSEMNEFEIVVDTLGQRSEDHLTEAKQPSPVCDASASETEKRRETSLDDEIGMCRLAG